MGRAALRGSRRAVPATSSPVALPTGPVRGSKCQGNFHTYGFEWDRSVSPNVFRWLVDGQQFHSVSQNDLPAATWTEISGHGYYILLNLAIAARVDGCST